MKFLMSTVFFSAQTGFDPIHEVFVAVFYNFPNISSKFST